MKWIQSFNSLDNFFAEIPDDNLGNFWHFFSAVGRTVKFGTFFISWNKNFYFRKHFNTLHWKSWVYHIWLSASYLCTGYEYADAYLLTYSRLFHALYFFVKLSQSKYICTTTSLVHFAVLQFEFELNFLLTRVSFDHTSLWYTTLLISCAS